MSLRTAGYLCRWKNGGHGLQSTSEWILLCRYVERWSVARGSCFYGNDGCHPKGSASVWKRCVRIYKGIQPRHWLGDSWGSWSKAVSCCNFHFDEHLWKDRSPHELLFEKQYSNDLKVSRSAVGWLWPRYEISTSLGSNARLISAATEDAGRRAKESQDIARKAEQEAKDVAETAIYLQKDYRKWFGLGKFFSDM